MALTEIKPKPARTCCSTAKCRAAKPDPKPGDVLRCDTCGRYWSFAWVIWAPDHRRRCRECSCLVPEGVLVCGDCAPAAVAPPPPPILPNYDPDGLSARRRDRRWRAR